MFDLTPLAAHCRGNNLCIWRAANTHVRVTIHHEKDLQNETNTHLN